jgi:hypothetical protein
MGGHGGKLTEEGKFAAVAAPNSFVAGGEFWRRRGHNVERGAECCACLVWTKGKNGEVFGGYLAEGEREGGMDGIWRAHNEKE